MRYKAGLSVRQAIVIRSVTMVQLAENGGLLRI